MTAYIRQLNAVMNLFGFDFPKTVGTITRLPGYFRELSILRNDARTGDFRIGRLVPCLGDRHEQSGSASGHYFHQDLLVARRVYENRPERHVDVGSRVDGFVAHVASFRPIMVIDIRALQSKVPNIEFIQADLMNRPKDELIGFCDSLSCLHALEHFGLARYGDPLRYDGYLVGLQNLSLLLKRGGKCYLSVPIGPQRIEFNAHRVFGVHYLLDCVADKFQIDHFSYVDDKGDLHDRVPLAPSDIERNFGCHYGCGIIEMTKI